MSQYEKALARLMSRPKDFTWRELQTIMNHFEYVERKRSGSRRKFVHDKVKEPLILHEPHPHGILKTYAVVRIINHLKRHNHI